MLSPAIILRRRRLGGSAWTPVSLFASGELGGYYDPSDISTLWQDSARTTPVTADGDPVGCIDDLSGNDLHMRQTVAGDRPLYKTSGGLHWLEQQDSGDHLKTTESTYGAEENFYFGAAANITTGGGIFTKLFGIGVHGSVPGSAGTCGAYQRSDGSTRQILAGLRINTMAAINTTISSAFTLGAPFVAESFHGSDVLTVRAGALSNTVAADNNTTNTSNLPFGVFPSAAVSRFYGGVAIMRATTSDERALIRAWLNARIGA